MRPATQATTTMVTTIKSKETPTCQMGAPAMKRGNIRIGEKKGTSESHVAKAPCGSSMIGAKASIGMTKRIVTGIWVCCASSSLEHLAATGLAGPS